METHSVASTAVQGLQTGYKKLNWAYLPGHLYLYLSETVNHHFTRIEVHNVFCL